MPQTNSHYLKNKPNCLCGTYKWWNKSIKQAMRIIMPNGPKHTLISKSTSQLKCGMTADFPIKSTSHLKGSMTEVSSLKVRHS
jgi:hypothetical protein